MTKKEEDLYPEIEAWLSIYLKEKYKPYSVITTYKTARQNLDVCLRAMGIKIDETIGLSIKVDVVGVLKRDGEYRLVFIEVKDKPLTLKDLGQLWGYSQLLNPVESFLVSSVGLGALARILNVYKREDLLKYGPKHGQLMKVCKWDVGTRAIDYSSLIPKL